MNNVNGRWPVMPALGLAMALIAQSAFATHTQEFYDMNSGAPWFASYSPTTPNSALGVSHGLTGNYLGGFGATSVSWFGLDNGGGRVNISFDLIVRGIWNAADTFDVTFSSSNAQYTSPVDTLVAFTSSPDALALGNAPLPAGVSLLYGTLAGPTEVAYHITTTTYAHGVDSFSSVGGWNLTFTGAPSSGYSAPYNATWGIDNLDVRWGASAVPEPASVMLLASALPLIAGAVYRRRRRRVME